MLLYSFVLALVMMCSLALMIRLVKWFCGFIYEYAPMILIFLVFVGLFLVSEGIKAEKAEQAVKQYRVVK